MERSPDVLVLTDVEVVRVVHVSHDPVVRSHGLNKAIPKRHALPWVVVEVNAKSASRDFPQLKIRERAPVRNVRVRGYFEVLGEPVVVGMVDGEENMVGLAEPLSLKKASSITLAPEGRFVYRVANLFRWRSVKVHVDERDNLNVLGMSVELDEKCTMATMFHNLLAAHDVPPSSSALYRQIVRWVKEGADVVDEFSDDPASETWECAPFGAGEGDHDASVFRDAVERSVDLRVYAHYAAIRLVRLSVPDKDARMDQEIYRRVLSLPRERLERLADRLVDAPWFQCFAETAYEKEWLPLMDEGSVQRMIKVNRQEPLYPVVRNAILWYASAYKRYVEERTITAFPPCECRNTTQWLIARGVVSLTNDERLAFRNVVTTKDRLRSAVRDLSVDWREAGNKEAWPLMPFLRPRWNTTEESILEKVRQGNPVVAVHDPSSHPRLAWLSEVCARLPFGQVIASSCSAGACREVAEWFGIPSAPAEPLVHDLKSTFCAVRLDGTNPYAHVSEKDFSTLVFLESHRCPVSIFVELLNALPRVQRVILVGDGSDVIENDAFNVFRVALRMIPRDVVVHYPVENGDNFSLRLQEFAGAEIRNSPKRKRARESFPLAIVEEPKSPQCSDWKRRMSHALHGIFDGPAENLEKGLYLCATHVERKIVSAAIRKRLRGSKTNASFMLNDRVVAQSHRILEYEFLFSERNDTVFGSLKKFSRNKGGALSLTFRAAVYDGDVFRVVGFFDYDPKGKKVCTETWGQIRNLRNIPKSSTTMVRYAVLTRSLRLQDEATPWKWNADDFVDRPVDFVLVCTDNYNDKHTFELDYASVINEGAKQKADFVVYTIGFKCARTNRASIYRALSLARNHGIIIDASDNGTLKKTETNKRYCAR